MKAEINGHYFYESMTQRLESSFAYPGQLHASQNRKSPDYEFVSEYLRQETDSVFTGFAAC